MPSLERRGGSTSTTSPAAIVSSESRFGTSPGCENSERAEGLPPDQRRDCLIDLGCVPCLVQSHELHPLQEVEVSERRGRRGDRARAAGITRLPAVSGARG